MQVANIPTIDKKFNETIEYIKKYTGVNIYNFNEDPTSEVPAYIAYITRPDVRAAIHTGNNTFNHNNQLVCYKMLSDFANSTKPFVEDLLEHNGVMSYIYKRSGGNFVDVVIRRAGHIVPKDQPEVAKFVLDRFIEDFK